MNILSKAPSLSDTVVSNLYKSFKALISDRVVSTFLFILLLLAIIDAEQSWAGLLFALGAFVGIMPFLILAVSVAAVVRATGADRKIAGAFTGSPARSVTVAALAGALSPFCSCGVVPVIAALLRSGVPLAPVMAFWIASPIMDPEMFILTVAGIGMKFAVAKTLATIIMGLLAGYGVYLLRGYVDFSDPLRDTRRAGCVSRPLNHEQLEWRFWRSAERLGVFRAEIITTSAFLGKWLLLAFLLESLMTAYVPPTWISGFLGDGDWYEVPIAALAGIPAYLNGYAAIPLMAELMEMGMNPGAALAFMTAGAVSSIPAAMAVAVLVKRTVFAAYLLLGLAGATLTGALYAMFV